MEFHRITVDPRQMGGVPRLRGLRIPVATVVGMVADGLTEEDILQAYPVLEREDIRSPSCRVGEFFDRQCSVARGGGRLREAGHDAVHVRDYGLREAEDARGAPADRLSARRELGAAGRSSPLS